jgi:hypothetical protein
MLAGTVEGAPPHVKGFDINEPLSTKRARGFHERGYRFCLRYVGREHMADNDLSTEEAKRLLGAGLAIMPVQHVESEKSWIPTPAKGTLYGTNAGRFAKDIGFPEGVNIWLDLECVEPHVPKEDVIAYCNNWFDQVEAAGYRPGIYVGFRPILSGEELRKRLEFRHYWGAYNVDVSIPGRGWQMKQKDVKNVHQDDQVRVDEQGDRVHWLQPAGWVPALVG